MLFRAFFVWWDDLMPFHRVLFACAMVVVALGAVAGMYSITEEGRGPHEQPSARTIDDLNGSNDRMYCESYCRQGQGVLIEFSNGGRHTGVFQPPRCMCLATDGIITGDPE